MNFLKNKTRVFYHEFGHFTAAYYNKIYFGKYGTQSITIIPAEYRGSIDFKGFHKPVEPPDYKSTDPIKHPASMIASTVYGCMFQSIFQSKEFSFCFNAPGHEANGEDDYAKVWRVANRFSLDMKDKDALDICFLEQFNAMRNEPAFADLFKIDISDLLTDDPEPENILPEDLEPRFVQFLNAHAKSYKDFVERLESIFREHTDRSFFK